MASLDSVDLDNSPKPDAHSGHVPVQTDGNTVSSTKKECEDDWGDSSREDFQLDNIDTVMKQHGLYKVPT